MKHKRSGAVAVAVLWAVMAWAVGTKGKADMPTLDWLGREEAAKQPYRKLVIFGVGPARLAEAKIDFRQTPYDILKGRYA